MVWNNNLSCLTKERYFIPSSFLGKISLFLILFFIISLGIFFIFLGMGERIDEKFFSNLKLSIPFLFSVSSGIGSFLTGFISIIKFRECSVLVFISTLTGFFVILSILSGILFLY